MISRSAMTMLINSRTRCTLYILLSEQLQDSEDTQHKQNYCVSESVLVIAPSPKCFRVFRLIYQILCDRCDDKVCFHLTLNCSDTRQATRDHHQNPNLLVDVQSHLSCLQSPGNSPYLLSKCTTTPGLCIHACNIRGSVRKYEAQCFLKYNVVKN